MPDLPTRLDYFQLGRDRVVQTARKIDPGQVNVQGSDANLFVGVAAVLSGHLTKQLAYRTSALTLDGSDDEDLDRYAYDRYGLTRKGASSARGSVTISRTSTAAGAGSIPIGTKLLTDAGYEYVTTTVATFAASSTIATCKARAAQAGKATQVGAGAIKRFAQPSLLFDTTLTVTNVGAMAGGEDPEDDPTFRERVRDFWRSARRGILAAIEFGAKTVDGVVSAQAIEALTPGALPARVINLYIADSTGVASDALADDVRVALEDYRAAGIAVLISTSIPQLAAIELALQFAANVDTKTLTDEIVAAVVEFVNTIPVNGTLYRGELFSVLQRFAADGLIPNEDTIVAPTGDLVPAVGQTIRTTTSNVTVL